ncbi:MAG: GNAT family N-acetyltransferase [Ktedonobacterales bacterium]
MWVEPVTLVGEVARLEPLELTHAAALFAASQYPRIWDYMPTDPSASVASIRTWIVEMLAAREAGTQLSFVIFDRATNTCAGSTSYLDIQPPHRNLEIGWTWLTPAVQRTALNTECKYLLLRHAFETLGAIRVQLKTDRRNEISQRAIERLGAVREGILRKQRIVRDGYQRDTVMYSITDDEWPAVKAGLEAELRRR